MYLLENAPRDALCAFMLVCKCVLAFACMSTHVNLSVCVFVGVSLSQNTVCVCVCLYLEGCAGKLLPPSFRCSPSSSSSSSCTSFFVPSLCLSISFHLRHKHFFYKKRFCSWFPLSPMLSHNSHCCRGKWWHGTQWCRSGVGSKKHIGLFVWSWNLNIDIAASIEMFVGMMLRMWVSHTCDQDM